MTPCPNCHAVLTDGPGLCEGCQAVAAGRTGRSKRRPHCRTCGAVSCRCNGWTPRRYRSPKPTPEPTKTQRRDTANDARPLPPEPAPAGLSYAETLELYRRRWAAGFQLRHPLDGRRVG